MTLVMFCAILKMQMIIYKAFSKRGIHMKKVYLFIAIFTLICCLNGIPNLVEGITARGWGGVNYGSVFLPLLISGIFFRMCQRNK